MVILVVALIVLGPDRLPAAARKAGELLGDLRRVSSGFEAEVRTAIYEAEDPERYRRPASPPIQDQTVQDQSVQDQRESSGAPGSEPKQLSEDVDRPNGYSPVERDDPVS